MIVNDVAKPADTTKALIGPKPGPKAGDPGPYYRLHVFCWVNVRRAGHPRGCC
jgi:hypothetical protein